MLIAVTGGTGTLGHEVVAALAARGHAVRSLSRHAPADLPGGVEHRRVDLLSGAGLDGALDGADALIDASNGGPRRDAAAALLVDGGRRLLEAEGRAGVSHHVGVSIVGVDRVPYGYYGVKLEQESLVRRAAVPWTIVRATQFHGLLDGLFAAAARFGLLPGAPFPMQPVDAREVAQVLADTVEAEPSGAITQFAGPEVAPVGDLARTWRRETGRRALVVPVPVPGATGRALAAGELTNPGAWSGRVSFAGWLRERAGAPPAAARVPVGRAMEGAR